MDPIYQRPRASVKQRSGDKNKAWKDKFRQQYSERVKSARQDQHDKRREDKFVQLTFKDEWEAFVRNNEEAMRSEGIDDSIALEIEKEIMTDYAMMKENSDCIDYNEDEEAELSYTIQCYEEEQSRQQALFMSIDTNGMECMECKNTTLFTSVDSNGVKVMICSSCGFSLNEKTTNAIQKTLHEHTYICSGSIGYMLDPESKDSLLGICNTCDLWTMT
ncbi:hypothetical protein BDF14DRAFT_1468303 [Spinellus fusiger]|nr:hypothetical protein BDF14DRAFT_1468303 [Spinellus fusiger]